MTTIRLLIFSFSLLLIIPFTVHIARAPASSSTGEINVNADIDVRPSFPAHWGPPPRAQTRDFVQLPGEYGRGSGTLRNWILTKMAEDDGVAAASSSGSTKSATAADGQLWPDKNLVGMAGDEAKAAVLAGDSKLLTQNIHVVPHDGMFTMDDREGRVRIFVDDDGIVVRQPKIG
mmetsp:Transcript_36179/g.65162  ORF Transcript_36179/g.65162 Transcript_36179/m.65162 type:complete len:175 (+) Transcript_36179:65-589(+)